MDGKDVVLRPLLATHLFRRNVSQHVGDPVIRQVAGRQHTIKFRVSLILAAPAILGV